MTIKWEPDVTLTEGGTAENFMNLSEKFKKTVLSQFEGTLKGRQELYGEMLDETTGALWTMRMLEELRIKPSQTPQFVRVVVAIDPMVTDIGMKENLKNLGVRDTKSAIGGSETGIIVAALGVNKHVYVIADRSVSASPLRWASLAVDAAREYSADRIVGEENNGGALVETVIRGYAPNMPYKSVKASVGKYTRAEPISALYEQGRVHHVGTFLKLEEQMITFTNDPKQKSPDRLDALVWAVAELLPALQYTPFVPPVSVVRESE